MHKNRIVFAILSGGKGRRIGGRKAHIMLAGRPMITYVADRLDTPLAVVGDPDAAHIVNATALLDPNIVGIKGPLLGILAALEWAKGQQADRVMIAPCDCPLLPHDIVKKLYHAALETGCACLASNKGVEPLISIWPSSQADKIRSILEGGTHPPLHHLMHEIGSSIIRLDYDEQLLNVNTPQELLIAKALLEKESPKALNIIP